MTVAVVNKKKRVLCLEVVVVDVVSLGTCVCQTETGKLLEGKVSMSLSRTRLAGTVRVLYTTAAPSSNVSYNVRSV